jgi:Acetyltransferases, including N-acetylases of ribosomal proteins
VSRKIYCQNELVSLVETNDEDYKISYDDWLDADTQKGYNHKFIKSFDEYRSQVYNARFEAMIMRNSDGCMVGEIGVARPEVEPDLAIRIFNPYRRMGYGASAFALATKYALENLDITELHAGAYQDNTGSLKMLEKCGYDPYPEGNLNEKHYLTGADIVQYDFIVRKER